MGSGEAIEEAEKSVEDGEGVGRTTGNEEVDGDEGVGPVEGLVVVEVGASGDGASAHGDHDLRGYMTLEIYLAARSSHAAHYQGPSI